MNRLYTQHQKSKHQIKYAWSDDERRHLLKNYHLMSVEDLAKYYEKPESSVRRQALAMMLTKRGK